MPSHYIIVLGRNQIMDNNILSFGEQFEMLRGQGFTTYSLECLGNESLVACVTAVVEGTKFVSGKFDCKDFARLLAGQLEMIGIESEVFMLVEDSEVSALDESGDFLADWTTILTGVVASIEEQVVHHACVVIDLDSTKVVIEPQTGFVWLLEETVAAYRHYFPYLQDKKVLLRKAVDQTRDLRQLEEIGALLADDVDERYPTLE